MIEALSADERSDALRSLPAWRYDADRKAFYRQLRFADFKQALGAMVTIGLEAEKADHHPEWANVYNILDIWLTTHDANGVSTRDVALAQSIDALVSDRVS
jgi:4a-hydroxytetrahydrobiopterin dehydratase